MLQNNLQFEKLCDEIQIGKQVSKPNPITGGFMHQMYKLMTTKGDYAVKVINPNIMQRENALNNFIFSEQVARIAKNNGIPCIPAILHDNRVIHEIDGQYYLVFEWVNGKALFNSEIEVSHCKKIGALLAKIHHCDFTQAEKNTKNIRNVTFAKWDYYEDKWISKKDDWAVFLQKNINKLNEWNELAMHASKHLSSEQVISHKDLDAKNVLWDKDNNPVIIDWESAGYINPTNEVLEVALNWSGMANKDLFIAVIESYKQNGGELSNDIVYYLQASLCYKLEWVSYNIKRVLKLVCTDEVEENIGKSEIIKTVKELDKYVNNIDVILSWT